jgi:hypothetical protein
MLQGACTIKLFKAVIHYESSVMHFEDRIPSGDFPNMVQSWYPSVSIGYHHLLFRNISWKKSDTEFLTLELIPVPIALSNWSIFENAK